jgi:hypothetical protein
MAEDEKKPQDSDSESPSETMLATEQQRDPDEAVLAEEAIHSYANEALEQFRQQVEMAMGNVTAWVEGHADQLDAGSVGPQLGEAFLSQMVSACGGMDSPIGAAIYEQLEGEIDQLVRDESEAGRLVDGLSMAARDFDWYLRDNLQSVLSHQWDQLRDLAYEGSTDFVAALHAFGLPQLDFSGGGLQSGLIAVGETVLSQQPKTQDEAVERDPEQEKQEQAQALLEADEKNPATV